MNYIFQSIDHVWFYRTRQVIDINENLKWTNVENGHSCIKKTHSSIVRNELFTVRYLKRSIIMHIKYSQVITRNKYWKISSVTMTVVDQSINDFHSLVKTTSSTVKVKNTFY